MIREITIEFTFLVTGIQTPQNRCVNRVYDRLRRINTWKIRPDKCAENSSGGSTTWVDPLALTPSRTTPATNFGAGSNKSAQDPDNQQSILTNPRLHYESWWEKEKSEWEREREKRRPLTWVFSDFPSSIYLPILNNQKIGHESRWEKVCVWDKKRRLPTLVFCRVRSPPREKKSVVDSPSSISLSRKVLYNYNIIYITL